MGIEAARESVTQPKQKRSVESFARIRAAVVSLLQERGSAQFSLAEVSALSGVSVGAIYGRVGSKADLLRVVQAEEFDRLDDETRELLSRTGERSTSFEDAVGDVVRTFVTILHDNAPLLGSFLRLSSEDEAILARGSRSGDVSQGAFCSALWRVASAFDVSASEESVRWCHEIAYSVSVRHLGFSGASTTPGAPLDRNVVAARLTRSICLYLMAE